MVRSLTWLAKNLAFDLAERAAAVRFAKIKNALERAAKRILVCMEWHACIVLPD